MTVFTRPLLLLLSFLLSVSFLNAQSLISVNQIPLDFKLLSFSLIPGDIATIENKENYDIIIKDGNSQTIVKAKTSYEWKAPEQEGLIQMEIHGKYKVNNLNLFVMTPMNEIKKKNSHFSLGEYPKQAYKNLNQYECPRGMIKVTAENQDTFISEHLQLKNFLSKNSSEFPKFVLISPKLIYKLELIIKKLKEESYPVEYLHVLSGYRTPKYNKSIGNGSSSRHIYGDAADIYVDNNKDSAMDDLNEDGKTNVEDANIIAKVVDEIDNEPKYKWLIGGMGVYRANGVHRGFVHVDTRGFLARW